MDRAWQIAGESGTTLALPGQARDCGNEALRVRMARVREQTFNTRLLDYPAQVHHSHPLAQVTDNCHIVGDEQDRQVELLSKHVEQLQDGCLH
jgi:hypothetical protein